MLNVTPSLTVDDSQDCRLRYAIDGGKLNGACRSRGVLGPDNRDLFRGEFGIAV